MIQAFSKLGMEDGTGSNGNTEERYSVYDDDESWPRKLNTEERQMAGELFDAVEVGALERTEEILKEVPPLANVIRLSQNSDFPLYLAAGMGDIRMVQLLVSHDCSVHAYCAWTYGITCSCTFWSSKHCTIFIRLWFGSKCC